MLGFERFRSIRFFFFALLIIIGTESFAQSYNLLDNRGSTAPGTTWLYSGLPADSSVMVASCNQTITCFTDGAFATPYFQTVVDYASVSGTDSWSDYQTTDGSVRMWGSEDEGESIRVDGGLDYGSTMVIGQTNISTAAAYDGGAYLGEITSIVTLRDIVSVSVPAGTFTNCLHLRFILEGIQTRDEWWAHGVGMVNLRKPGSAL